MNYIVLALLASVCFALGQIITKVLSKRGIDNKDSLMAYFLLSTFTFNLFLLPFVNLTLPSLEAFKLLFLVVGAFLIGYYFFYTGIFHADASSFAPLFQMQAALIGLFAFLFLGERFPVQNYLFMGLMLVGGVLVSLNEKMSLKTFLNKGILFISLMQICHAISGLFIGFTLKLITPIQLLFWENMIIGLAFVVFYFLKEPKMSYKGSEVAPMFLSSYIVAIGVLSLLNAFAVNLTISSVIGLLSAPIVFVVSLIASRFSPTFLEHHPPKVYFVRGLGLLMILLAAYKIVIG